MEFEIPQGRNAHTSSLSMRTRLTLRQDYSNELERLQIFEAI